MSQRKENNVVGVREAGLMWDGILLSKWLKSCEGEKGRVVLEVNELGGGGSRRMNEMRQVIT